LMRHRQFASPRLQPAPGVQLLHCGGQYPGWDSIRRSTRMSVPRASAQGHHQNLAPVTIHACW
jgi:hypothetical protein